MHVDENQSLPRVLNLGLDHAIGIVQYFDAHIYLKYNYIAGITRKIGINELNMIEVSKLG